MRAIQNVLFIEFEPLCQKLWAFLSNFDFSYDARSQIWECHVTQEANFDFFLFCSNSTFNIRKSHKISSGKALYGSCSVHQLTFVKYFGLDQLLFLLAHFAAIFCIKTREPLLCKSAKTLTAKQVQSPYGNETDYITKHLKSRSALYFRSYQRRTSRGGDPPPPQCV